MSAVAALRPRPVAIVAHTHPSLTKGGAEIAAQALHRGLIAAGEPAIFVAAVPASDRGRVRLGPGEFAVAYDPFRYDHLYELGSPDVWRQLRAILTETGARLVNFHHFLNFGFDTIRAVRDELGLPFVLTVHEFLLLCAHFGQMVTRPERRLCRRAAPDACALCFPEHREAQFAARERLMRDAAEGAASLVAPSRFLAERMEAHGIGRGRFAIIDNGLMALPELTSQAPMRRGARRVTFGYFGQITPFKGVDTLLDAADILASEGFGDRIAIRVHGNRIGLGAAFEARFDAALSRHAFLEAAGPYDNESVFSLMAACDWVVAPSTWWENSPVVIQEAIAARRPVIATALGGLAEKVEDGVTGLTFRLRDGADLARAMREACAPELAARLADNLPPPRDNAAMARDYAALYARVLAPETVPEIRPARPRRRARA